MNFSDLLKIFAYLKKHIEEIISVYPDYISAEIAGDHFGCNIYDNIANIDYFNNCNIDISLTEDEKLELKKYFDEVSELAMHYAYSRLMKAIE